MAQPTPELQQAITHLHAAIATEQDPRHMATLGQCLTQMMKVQADLMQGGQGGQGGGQAGGPPGMQQGGPPPAGPQTAADPRLASLAAALGG